mmetsp:Transcript_45348/g.125851  ORF Transcript_45348/g.125851 Transcript_45348/m.125851 type:complete len:283 (+) Transcript_45348:1311-2159(+)
MLGFALRYLDSTRGAVPFGLHANNLIPQALHLLPGFRVLARALSQRIFGLVQFVPMLIRGGGLCRLQGRHLRSRCAKLTPQPLGVGGAVTQLNLQLLHLAHMGADLGLQLRCAAHDLLGLELAVPGAGVCNLCPQILDLPRMGGHQLSHVGLKLQDGIVTVPHHCSQEPIVLRRSRWRRRPHVLPQALHLGAVLRYLRTQRREFPCVALDARELHVLRQVRTESATLLGTLGELRLQGRILGREFCRRIFGIGLLLPELGLLLHKLRLQAPPLRLLLFELQA